MMNVQWNKIDKKKYNRKQMRDIRRKWYPTDRAKDIKRHFGQKDL